MAKSDYFNWDDDLDLDLLLGEYTDQENVCDDELDDGDFLVPHESNSKRRKTDTDSTVDSSRTLYKCPVCGKCLKTISGFRGHTTKQHGLSNLKASENRDGAMQNVEVQGTADSSINIDDIFEDAYNATVKLMQNDPVMKILKWQSEAEQISESMQNQPVKDFFQTAFREIFNSDINITMEKDREVLFTKLHRMRLSDSMQKEVISLIASFGFDGETRHLHGYTQDFILEMLSQLLKNQVLKLGKKSSNEQEKITENDQKILFYIAGYIIRALKKKYMKLNDPEDKMNCLDNLRCNSDASTFVTKYKSWTEKNNRGGLEYPRDEYYLLVREIENIVRKNISTDISADSLLKEKLKESIMESFMVKHYSTILFNEMTGSVGVTIIEDIINLFLTVRGYATARVKRNELIKAKKSKGNSKSSSSLRQTLKQMPT